MASEVRVEDGIAEVEPLSDDEEVDPSEDPRLENDNATAAAARSATIIDAVTDVKIAW